MDDNKTTLQELKELIADFVHEREWEQFHAPKNLAMSIAIEAAELMEIFQWSNETKVVPEQLEKISEELADVVIYCLAMTNVTGIDLSRIIKQKVNKNAQKYPVEKYRGRY